MNSYCVEWLEKDYSGEASFQEDRAEWTLIDAESKEEALEKAKRYAPRGYCFEVLETVK